MSYLEIVVYLIISRTATHLRETGYGGIFDKFPRIGRIANSLTDEMIYAWAHAGAKETARYEALLSLVGNDRFQDDVLQSVIDLCLATNYIPEFSAFLQYHTGSPVTLHLAYALEGIRFPDAADISAKIECLGAVTYIDQKKSPVCYAELSMEDRVFDYLMGNDRLDGRLAEICTIQSAEDALHPLYLYEEIAEEGARFLAEPGRLIQLAGPGGRRFLAKQIGARLGKSVLFLAAGDLGVPIGPAFDVMRMVLMREAHFRDACVCVYGITREVLERFGMNELVYAKRLSAPALERRIPLILCTDADMMIAGAFDDAVSSGGVLPVRVFELEKGSYLERARVWQGFARQYGMELDIPHYASRYHLTPSEIAGVIAMWRAGKRDERDGDEFSFSRLCYDVASKGLEDKIGKVIYPTVLMSDLMVEKPVRDLLGQAIASVNGSHQIFEEWNLKKKYAYGRAVTVLLTGPPGTGKTMSAHAIAHELGIPLYQVNLANIVDKYIGETEKHLEQAFSFAEKTNMVLFFDEADSLFGKRSEVSDARDRYANTEVSYLLQRIEQYEGIAIMATNFINNIDPAFLRRIKYVIRFQPPDERQRLAIWKNCILPELPVDDLDLPYLARQFDFTGGTIKNVLLNACAIAVYEEETLNMRHILKAIRDEYIKTDRIVDMATWGEYGYLADLLTR